MFPGAHAQIYRNDAGEVIGWDYPDGYDPYDPNDYLDPDHEDDDEDPFEEPAP